MPKFSLELKANLENVTDLIAEGSDFRWYLKLKCASCGEVPDHWHYVCLEEKLDIDGSRGTAHFVQKCKLCGRQNQLEILPETLKGYDVEKNLEWQHVITFDCRGLEPVDFDPRRGWSLKAVDSDTSFQDVSLEEKDWCDYDEKAGCSVGVYELESRFHKVK